MLAKFSRQIGSDIILLQSNVVLKCTYNVIQQLFWKKTQPHNQLSAKELFPEFDGETYIFVSPTGINFSWNYLFSLKADLITSDILVQIRF
jgi:hypothetical protein